MSFWLENVREDKIEEIGKVSILVNDDEKGP